MNAQDCIRNVCFSIVGKVYKSHTKSLKYFKVWIIAKKEQEILQKFVKIYIQKFTKSLETQGLMRKYAKC